MPLLNHCWVPLLGAIVRVGGGISIYIGDLDIMSLMGAIARVPLLAAIIRLPLLGVVLLGCIAIVR